MPLQRRLPKVGFRSILARQTAEIRLHELNGLEVDTVDMAALKKANLVSASIKRAKIFASGEITRAVTVKSIRVTKGARAAIEAAGGKIED
jgi:large subunit ribosomal protein L15